MKKEKIYDLNIISQAVGGDKESLKDMIRIFLTTLPPYFANMKTYIDNKNWKEVSKIAHTVKSNIDMIGVKSSFYKIKEIEYLSKQEKDTEKIPSLFQDVEKEMNSVLNDLKTEIEQ